MLLGAGGDQEIGDREAVPASLAELSVSGNRNRKRFGIHPQITEGGQILFNLLVLAR